MIFKRKIYNELQQWKRTDEGRTAVLIQGARRVGKSTIAKEFAENEYETHILVDFAACSTEIRDLFNDVSDLNRIFMRLQLEYGVELKDRKSVIIFDEVQLAPKARQAIKYLVKDGRYDYIETGSLISIRKNVKDILIPSEEVKLHMFPMDYEEFRWALGDTATIRLLQGCFHDRASLGDATNRKLMRDFRLYMLVGGMPQAVATYLASNNLEKVDSVKRSIITLYEDDFNKIDPTGNASKIFRQIPAQLTGNANRYLAWSATDGTRNSVLAEILSEIRESMVVNMAYHANDPSAGMALHQDPNKYKMFAGDTGLFVTLAFWDRKFTDNTIYHKLLSDKLSTDLGYVYENVVAQMLKASGHELYYYTFPTGSGKHNYEVDFLIADGDKVSPVEVKSSGYKAHTSLDAFCGKFSSRIRNKYLVYTKDMRKDGDVLYLPVYMTMFL
ncbi:ATP-binding protein [Bacteroides thetaiotaomicron]|uniref:ATP-binding protein n=1 Tax=Bacteroides thetaiotaomicron TaxID=818 RepID=UPI001F176B7B|nr:AAA family ATPase [Bacteroides thetaiotaomicron]